MGKFIFDASFFWSERDFEPFFVASLLLFETCWKESVLGLCRISELVRIVCDVCFMCSSCQLHFELRMIRCVCRRLIKSDITSTYTGMISAFAEAAASKVGLSGTM